MRCFGLFLSLFILCSCGSQSQIHEDIKDINNTIVSLEKELPVDCKTPETNAKIETIKAKLQQVETRCETQIEVLKSEKTQWRVLFYSLAAVMAVYFAGRLLK